MKKFLAVITFLFLANFPLVGSAKDPIPPAYEGRLFTPELQRLLLSEYLGSYRSAAKFEVAGESLGDLSYIFVNLIFNALLISGAIFVGLIVYGGTRWLLAHGNEEEIIKAKNLVLHTAVGLAIVLSAYSVSFYIIRAATSILIYNVNAVRNVPDETGQVEGFWPEDYSPWW